MKWSDTRKTKAVKWKTTEKWRDTQVKESQEAGKLQAPELPYTEKMETNKILPYAAPCNFPEIFYNFPWSPMLTAGRC